MRKNFAIVVSIPIPVTIFNRVNIIENVSAFCASYFLSQHLCRTSRERAIASDCNGNRDACMYRVELPCRSAMKFKDLRDIHRFERVRRILTVRIPPFITESIEVQRHCPRCVIPETIFNSMFGVYLKKLVSRNMVIARGSLAGKDL